jgi:hypothetical protein
MFFPLNNKPTTQQQQQTAIFCNLFTTENNKKTQSKIGSVIQNIYERAHDTDMLRVLMNRSDVW